MQRFFVALQCLLMTVLVVAQKRQQFTLYDKNSGAVKRIKEGKYIDVAILSDKCPGWDKHEHGLSGELLRVGMDSITIAVHAENITCTQGDSTFTWHSEDAAGQARTIPYNHIQYIMRGGEDTPEVLSGILFGASFMAIFIVAPLASIKWFNGWNFNTDTYTTVAKGGLIGMGIIMPLYLICSSRSKLVPEKM